jgi:hypothetical protein
MSEQKAHEYLEVIVNYPAAKKPFEQEHASSRETVGALKSAVLKAFWAYGGADQREHLRLYAFPSQDAS